MTVTSRPVQKNVRWAGVIGPSPRAWTLSSARERRPAPTYTNRIVPGITPIRVPSAYSQKETRVRPKMQLTRTKERAA